VKVVIPYTVAELVAEARALGRILARASSASSGRLASWELFELLWAGEDDWDARAAARYSLASETPNPRRN